MELSACTRGGEKLCNLIAVGPKSGAQTEGHTKQGKSWGKVKARRERGGKKDNIKTFFCQK